MSNRNQTVGNTEELNRQQPSSDASSVLVDSVFALVPMGVLPEGYASTAKATNPPRPLTPYTFRDARRDPRLRPRQLSLPNVLEHDDDEDVSDLELPPATPTTGLSSSGSSDAMDIAFTRALQSLDMPDVPVDVSYGPGEAPMLPTFDADKMDSYRGDLRATVSHEELNRTFARTGVAPDHTDAAIHAVRHNVAIEGKELYEYARDEGLTDWLNRDARRLPPTACAWTVKWTGRVFFAKSAGGGNPFLDPVEERQLWQARYYLETRGRDEDDEHIRRLANLLALRANDSVDLERIVHLRTHGHLGTGWTVPRVSFVPRCTRWPLRRV